MSDTTDRDPHACMAHGCPCAGSFTTSTSGGNDWACWQHLRAERSDWQRITAEMNRLRYLVDACSAIRSTGSKDRETSKAILAQVNQSLRAAQRSDLCYSPEDKTVYGWLCRLESALSAAARQTYQ